VESLGARLLFYPLLLPLVGDVILTVNSPLGRKARPKLLSRGDLLFRVKPIDLLNAGVTRVPKIAGVDQGQPITVDGRTIAAANVIWSTGFRPGFSWIKLPVFEEVNGRREPRHRRGVVSEEPGLFFVGLKFLYSLSSSVINGVGRDAKYVVEAINARNGGG
jgi:putative flavoprotein involved in K+ transport